MGGLNLGFLGLAPKSWNKKASNFLTGTPEKRENVSTLRPEQEGLYNQLINAGQGPGAGGAFGQSADYYRDLLSNDSDDINAFNAPAMRQFNEDIIPGLSEQFAGMGAGGLSSSGFRNAAINAGTDLSERLGSIRAQLRQSGAQGLSGIGQAGLANFSQNMTTQPGSSGLFGSIAPAIGGAIGTAVGGPIGGAIGSGLGSAVGSSASSAFGGAGNRVGANTNPYGGSGGMQASPRFQLPNFSMNPGGR